MFYKQFLKIIDTLDESFVEEFDFWLATLPERLAKTISVSAIASRFEVKYSTANAIVNFSEKEGILRKRYLVICGNEECQFFYGDFEADELVKIMGKKVYCHNCSKEFKVSYENVLIVYAKVKEPNIPEEKLEEEIMKRIGNTEKNESYGNFSIADSLAKNIDEVYELYYKPNESAYKQFRQLKEALDGPFTTTKEKGDALERLVLFLFQQIRNVTATNKVRTYTNQFDCTVCFGEYSSSFPSIMKYMSPYFIIECKNETTSKGRGKTPSNTYFHKLSGIMDSNNAKIGIIVSRGEPSKEDMIIAHDEFLLHKNTNCQKFLLSFSEIDLEELIDKKKNLLRYMNYKMNKLTMNANNASYDLLEQ